MQLVALFRLAFASAPDLLLNLATYGNSQDRSTKSTPSHLPCGIVLRLIVSTRFQVLFHSPSGVLFTFPSRYWFTIGRQVVFSLGRWSSRFPTGFHVSRGTLDTSRSLCLFAYRALTFCGATFHPLRLKQSFVTPYDWSTTPTKQAWLVWALPVSLAATQGIKCFFLFLRVLRCFSSPGSLYPDYVFIWEFRPIKTGGLPHSDIPGSKPAFGSPRLFVDRYVLHRLLTPRHSPCALCSLTL